MKPFSLNIKGRLVEYTNPVVMGIVNITPDSFFAGSRVTAEADIKQRAAQMVAEGADILDLGAYSTRPGAAEVSVEEEMSRLERGIKAVRRAVGDDVPLSVDTFRADVARACVEDWGADIVNDISGGKLDDRMFETVANLRVPYVLMHTRGTPATMQTLTDYADVVADVIGELQRSVWKLEEAGVADVIVDPGFGFPKTLEQNYEMLARLADFELLGKPLLVGVSRKSMFTRLLGIEAAQALVPTAVGNALALERGAAIVRVHDVAEARQTIAVVEAMKKQRNQNNFITFVDNKPTMFNQ